MGKILLLSGNKTYSIILYLLINIKIQFNETLNKK